MDWLTSFINNGWSKSPHELAVATGLLLELEERANEPAPVSARQIAERASVSRATARKHLQALESNGWIVRHEPTFGGPYRIERADPTSEPDRRSPETEDSSSSDGSMFG